MFNSNPWMLLLWIIALVMALIPLLIILWSGMWNGYFRAKQNYLSKIMKALHDTLSKAKKENKEGENKE